MAAFPTAYKILFDTSEAPAPVVIRSEMERGVPKQRRIAADSLVTVPISVIFFSKQQAADFETWFFGDINAGSDFFDWTDPRTGVLREARIVGGHLGELVPLRESYNMSRRSMTLEYVRRGFEVLAPGRYDTSPSRILSVQSDPGTYIDDVGVLQYAPANTARYEGGLLVVEPAATNIVTNSDVANPTVTGSGSSKSTQSGALPTGASGNFTEVVTGTAAVGSRFGLTTGGDTAKPHAGAVWAKTDTGTLSVTLDVNNATGQVYMLTTTWQRVSASAPASGADVFRFLDVLIAAGASGRKIHFFGAQVQEGSLTNYIPTAATAVTRAADIINVAV